MLTVERFGGLGAFTKTQDFSCVAVKGNYACVAKNSAALEAFKDLQITIQDVVAKIAVAGKLPVPATLTTLKVDGQPGYITALGVQFVGSAFASVVPPPVEVAAALESGLSDRETVERIAANADEISEYFQYVAANFPEAVAPPPEVVEKVVEKVVVKTPTRKFKAVGGVVLAAGFVTMLGFAANAVYHQIKGKPGDF